ncbi:MAG: hypothetical protein WBV39_07480 [Rudaea sp.]
MLEPTQQGGRCGDCVVAGVLQYACDNVFASSLLGQLTTIDAVESYRYLQLQHLGASGKFATRLDGQRVAATRQLAAVQVSDAGAWASDTYTRYFNGSLSNTNSDGVDVCPIAHE